MAQNIPGNQVPHQIKTSEPAIPTEYQPAPQDLRERAMDLWNKHSFIERRDKIVRALMTIDSFLFCVGALDEQKDKRIAVLQESEMRLMDANSRMEHRIAELEKQVFELIDFNKLNDPL